MKSSMTKMSLTEMIISHERFHPEISGQVVTIKKIYTHEKCSHQNG